MIHLKDNSSKVVRLTQDCEDIRLLANQTVETLVKSNPGLLVYPQSLKNCDDTLKRQFIISAYESEGADQQRYMHISTGNLIGFIGTSSTNLSICSRFTGDGDLKQDYFLHYMLQKVLSVNLFNFNHSISTEDQVFDFLLLLFPRFLKDAVAQGIYKEYVSVQRNDADVKGVINISRHINRNVPFRGAVAYSSREISFDNNITQLIRHTIEQISISDFGKTILSSDKETIESINQIKAATASYSRNNRMSVIRANSRLVNHPFFSRYQDLQKICLMILRHRQLKYGSSDNRINGILFDAAWLWEEYMAKLLPEFKHPLNRSGIGMISLAERNQLQRYPDFYRGEIGGVVLDAKYKHDVSRDDEHQVISYMYRLKSSIGGFLLPNESSKPKVSYSLLGYGNYLNIHYLQIPQQVNSYKEFSDLMRNYEEDFVTEINAL